MRIAVVGAGVVGQATGNGFAKHGHRITYIDNDVDKINTLRSENKIAQTPADTNYDAYECIFLCLPTPTVSGEIILTSLEDTVKQIAHTDAITVIRSTVPPGTTELLQLILPRLACNPEFLRAHSAQRDFDNPSLILLGSEDLDVLECLMALYRPFQATVASCTPTEAELIKYFHNCYNALKISYFNEVHTLCQHFEADSTFVSQIMAMTSEAAQNAFYGIRGGKPYGGACLPKDTEGFLHFLQAQGLHFHLLESTIRVNTELKHFQTVV